MSIVLETMVLGRNTNLTYKKTRRRITKSILILITLFLSKIDIKCWHAYLNILFIAKSKLFMHYSYFNLNYIYKLVSNVFFNTFILVNNT